MKNKNIIIGILSVCLIVSIAYIITIKKSEKIITNLVQVQNEYSELARNFSIEYNNLYRDQEHTDPTNLKNMCTEEFWLNNLAENHPSTELPDKLEVNTNNIEDIVCQVNGTGALVVVHGTQSFEYTSYRFVYMLRFNTDKKVEAMTILSYSD